METHGSLSGTKRSHPEFLADSAEQIAFSIDLTGLRDKITQVFQEAIARARGSQQKSSEPAISEAREVGWENDAF